MGDSYVGVNVGGVCGGDSDCVGVGDRCCSRRGCGVSLVLFDFRNLVGGCGCVLRVIRVEAAAVRVRLKRKRV